MSSTKKKKSKTKNKSPAIKWMGKSYKPKSIKKLHTINLQYGDNIKTPQPRFIFELNNGKIIRPTFQDLSKEVRANPVLRDIIMNHTPNFEDSVKGVGDILDWNIALKDGSPDFYTSVDLKVNISVYSSGEIPKQQSLYCKKVVCQSSAGPDVEELVDIINNSAADSKDYNPCLPLHTEVIYIYIYYVYPYTSNHSFDFALLVYGSILRNIYRK